MSDAMKALVKEAQLDPEVSAFLEGFATKFETLEKQSDLGEMLAGKAIGEAAKGISNLVGTGLKAAYRSATAGETKLNSKQKMFIESLVKADPILKQRKYETVLSHYRTMVKMAPSIALDRNAVNSFLRESTKYDTISLLTLKSLVELENKIREATFK